VPVRVGSGMGKDSSLVLFGRMYGLKV
jgi:hypothetical protein